MKGLLWSLLLVAVHVQCTGFNEVPTRCHANKDCPKNGICIFDLDDGCDGRGHCGQISRSSNCEAIACGCDGKPAFLVAQKTPFQTQCADGFDRPIVSTNACPK